MKSADLDEQERMLRQIQADPRRFDRVFDAYYPDIFNYAVRRTGDMNTAKDICSEVFLKAFLNIKRFRWEGVPILFWLYRIAGNEILQLHRKNKYRPGSLDLVIQSGGWDAIDSPEMLTLRLEEENARNAEFRLIQRRLRLLPGKYQEVIALRYFESRSIRDIALIVGKKEGTVKSLLSRGIEKLRGSL